MFNINGPERLLSVACSIKLYEGVAGLSIIKKTASKQGMRSPRGALDSTQTILHRMVYCQSID